MINRFSRLVAVASLASLTVLPACGKDNAVTGPTTLEITDITVGTGAAVVAGDTVTMNYIAAFLDGTVIDSSFSTGTPFTFQVAANPRQVIQGVDQGIVGMKIAGRRLLVIPSDLAYGSQGRGAIPPNTPLQFQIDLVSIAGK